MPSGQPLRDRCNVPMPVCTDVKLNSKRSRLQAKTISSCAGNTPLRSTHSCCRIPLPPLPSCYGIEEVPRTPHDEHGPRRFVPYLYFFTPPTPSAVPAGHWTHMIRFLPHSKLHPAGTAELIEPAAGGGPQALHLYVAPENSAQRRKVPLSAQHLLLARDFLGLALPYYTCARPYPFSPLPSPTSSFLSLEPETPLSHFALEPLAAQLPPPQPMGSQADPVRVLILGSPRAMLAIGLTYIAYASGRAVAHVMRSVLENDGGSEWCGLLGEDGEMGLGHEGMQVLERVAMKDM
ncbi:hypothetical protein B0H10DRAFT_2211018 [Mycena sp. CBHHK59/15]|nr:hypothetical protein B0H10DRAFT_2211018 [Mycena sp. CBHHK59/15]